MVVSNPSYVSPFLSFFPQCWGQSSSGGQVRDGSLQADPQQFLPLSRSTARRQTSRAQVWVAAGPGGRAGQCSDVLVA